MADRDVISRQEVVSGLYDRVVNGYRLYSQTVSAPATARLVFVSGQLSRNEAGEVIGVGDMPAQIEQAMRNLGRALENAGASLDSVVSTTTYTTDMDLYLKHVGAKMELFGRELPTSTTIGVSRLTNPQFLVEISAVAVAS